MGLELPAFEDLSDDQLEVLTLPTDRNYLVTGPPGSGKTVMAILRAQALKQKFGEDALLLMYGNLLHQYTGAAVEQLGVDSIVKTYHSWFPMWYDRAYGRKPKRMDLWTFDWPAIFEEMVAKPAPEQLKLHVIVDEGQDMPPPFYLVVRQLSKTLTVFADENQTLGSDNSTVEEIRQMINSPEPYVLTTNYRNTREIANVAAHFHSGLPTGVAAVPPSTRPGPRPVLVAHRTHDEWLRFLLNYERTNATRSIGVFLPRRDLMKALHGQLRGETKSPTQMYLARDHPRLDMTKPGIKVVSYPSAKGLEFDTVFVPALNEVRHDPGTVQFAMAYYVLASRARRELYFSYWGPGTPTVTAGLPLHLLEDRR